MRDVLTAEDSSSKERNCFVCSSVTLKCRSRSDASVSALHAIRTRYSIWMWLEATASVMEIGRVACSPHLINLIAPPPRLPFTNTSTSTLFRRHVPQHDGSLQRVQTRHPTVWTHHGSSTPAMAATQSKQMCKKFHVLSRLSLLVLTILILPSPD